MPVHTGRPIPRKSACRMGPYNTKDDWQTMAAEYPETFDRIAQLEDRRIARRRREGKGDLTYIYRSPRKRADGTTRSISG